jgi:hypothetical protein
MKSSTSAKRAVALVNLVTEEIVTNPYDLDGRQWCALPQPMIAEKIGASVATVRRITSREPFVRRQKEVDGIKRTLLRIGTPDPLTPCHVANIMSKLWRRWLTDRRTKLQEELDAARAMLATAGGQEKKEAFAQIKKIRMEFKRRRWTTSPREYGCMVGLAEVWPEGHQIELFEMVLDQWSLFMIGVKWIIVDQEMEDQKTVDRFWTHPSISVIRRFQAVAVEMALMDAQEKKKVPAWIKALHPDLWKATK